MTEEILNEETAQETATSGYADIQPVDEQPKNAIESLLTAEEREAIKYLNVDKTIRSLKERMADVNETTNGIIKNAEDGDMLDAAIKDFTVEQIKAMDPITLHRIYTVEETDQPIDLDISVDGSDYVDFMRDYLVLRKETMEANEKFDAEIAKLEAEIAACTAAPPTSPRRLSRSRKPSTASPRPEPTPALRKTSRARSSPDTCQTLSSWAKTPF